VRQSRFLFQVSDRELGDRVTSVSCAERDPIAYTVRDKGKQTCRAPQKVALFSQPSALFARRHHLGVLLCGEPRTPASIDLSLGDPAVKCTHRERHSIAASRRGPNSDSS
jgi:hypothetical protein